MFGFKSPYEKQRDREREMMKGLIDSSYPIFELIYEKGKVGRKPNAAEERLFRETVEWIYRCSLPNGSGRSMGGTEESIATLDNYLDKFAALDTTARDERIGFLLSLAENCGASKGSPGDELDWARRHLMGLLREEMYM